VHVPLMFLSEWREFSTAIILAGKRSLMTACVSMLLKSRASPDMFPFSLCNKKTCGSAHEQTPLSNDTIDSVVQHREVGRAKGLSAPPRMYVYRVSQNLCHKFSWGFPTPIKQKGSYQHGSKSEEVPRY